MVDYPSVSVMVPLDGNANLQGNLLSVWSSWYKLDWPEEKLKFIFAIPDGSPERDFVKANFKRKMEIISCQVRYTAAPKDRFLELSGLRNVLLERGRTSDYGWFLDSDVMPPPNAIQCFTEDNADIVGGVVRIPDNHANIRYGFGYFRPYYDFGNTIPSEFFEVDSINTACMFIDKPVMNNPEVSFKLWSITENGEKFDISEDHGYCLAAGKAGYTIWVDARVKCKHLRVFNGKIVPLVVD